jgi:quercetin dioxygenase-like cupin family protein
MSEIQITETAAQNVSLLREIQNAIPETPLIEDPALSSTRSATQNIMPQVFRRSDAKVYEAFSQKATFIMSSADIGGKLCYAEVEVAPQIGPPYHVHRDEDEVLFVKSGHFELIVNGERTELFAGDIVYGPRDVPHTWRNIGEGTAVMHVLAIDGAFDVFFSRCAQEFNKGGAPDMGAIFGIAAEHGIEFLAPDAPPLDISAFPRKPFVLRAGEGEILEYPSSDLRMLLTQLQTNGEYSLFSGSAASGDGPPPHFHLNDDEVFFIEEGELAFRAGDEQMLAGAGDIVWAPRGTHHQFRCVSSTAARLMIMVLPSNFENYFRETARIFAEGKVSPETIKEISTRYGMQPLPVV